jgi:transcriptional regulator with XRE-family HTH domain
MLGPVMDGELGARIANARQQHGLTQEQLGAAVGLARNQICKIEKGERRVAAPELGKLAAALSCDLESLLFPEYAGSPRFRGSVKNSGAESDLAWLRQFRRRYDDLVNV